MRARRLAKLGGGTASSSATTGSSSSASQDSAAAAASPRPTASPASPASPVASSTPTPAPTTRLITITPRPPPADASSGSGNNQDRTRADREASPSKRPRLALAANTPAGVPQKQPQQPQPQPPAAKPTPTATRSTPTPNPVSAADALAEWTDSTISSLLHVTVSPDQTQNRHGTPLTLLKDLRGEIQDRAGGEDAAAVTKPLRLTVDDIDPAFLEACSAFCHKKPLLDYLLPVYKAVNRLLKSRITAPQRVAVLQEIKRLCMSNIIFALTMPEYFGCAPLPCPCPCPWPCPCSPRVLLSAFTTNTDSDVTGTLCTIPSCRTSSAACAPTTRSASTWIS